VRRAALAAAVLVLAAGIGVQGGLAQPVRAAGGLPELRTHPLISQPVPQGPANVTAVDGTAGTFFTLYPASGSPPVASDVNVAGGQNRPNLVIVGLSAGDVDLYNDLGTINAIVDVEGWFA
jgi:hypothetical protein